MTKIVCTMVNWLFIAAKGKSAHSAFDGEMILALEETHLVKAEYCCKGAEQYRGPDESNGHLNSPIIADTGWNKQSCMEASAKRASEMSPGKLRHLKLRISALFLVRPTDDVRSTSQRSRPPPSIMARKRGANGRPFGRDQPSATGSRDSSKLTINTFEDVADSEDEFHINRDKILLEEGPAQKWQRKALEQGSEGLQVQSLLRLNPTCSNLPRTFR